jgi:hypothetical protein
MMPILILDENSLQDTIYNILIIILGLGALLIGTISSVDGRIQRRATLKLQQEIKEAIRELKNIDNESDAILHELEKDEKLDREMLEKLDKKA